MIYLMRFYYASTFNITINNMKYHIRVTWTTVIGSILLIGVVRGAPRHRVIHSPNKHSSENVSTENAVSRSYIDIDASDPFKVPKGSHYIDQTLPNFDKEEAEAKATVENTEQSPSDDSEEDSDGDHSAPDDDQQPDGGSEENAASNIADEIPDSVKEKINELSMDSKDGKPIEINEKDLQNMLNKDDKN